MGWIFGWIVGKIKWLLLIAAIGGPVLAYTGWEDGQRLKLVQAAGITATASIDGGTRTKRRRSGTTHKVNLSWTDAQGKARSAQDVLISRRLADRIIVGDSLVVDQMPIKYMAAVEDNENVIILDDQAEKADTNAGMIALGAGGGAFGLVGAGLMFWLGSRRREIHQRA